MGIVEESGAAGAVLNHVYGYVGQNLLVWIDSYSFAPKGNHKLDQNQLDRIKEQLQDPNRDRKKRNEL